MPSQALLAAIAAPAQWAVAKADVVRGYGGVGPEERLYRPGTDPGRRQPAPAQPGPGLRRRRPGAWRPAVAWHLPWSVRVDGTPPCMLFKLNLVWL